MEPPAAEAAELWACPLLVAEHEYAIFFGDLNYRIDLDGDRVRQMALNGELSGLREHDQLLLARRDKARARVRARARARARASYPDPPTL